MTVKSFGDRVIGMHPYVLVFAIVSIIVKEKIKERYIGFLVKYAHIILDDTDDVGSSCTGAIA